MTERIKRFYERTSDAAELEARAAREAKAREEVEYVEKRLAARRYYVASSRVVFGDRTLNGVPIGRTVEVRRGPYKSWQAAKDARANMGPGAGRIVIG